MYLEQLEVCPPSQGAFSGFSNWEDAHHAKKVVTTNLPPRKR